MSATLFHPEFGEKLRRAREEKKLSLADVAAKLKLSARQIEALEAEDLAHLPGDVFARGFVRNYARLVGVDPDQLIVPVDPNAGVPETITAPSEGVIFTSPRLRRWILLPLLALLFFVSVVALVYYWLRQGEAALVPPVSESAVTVVTPPVLEPAMPPVPVAPVVVDTPASEPVPPAQEAVPTPAQPPATSAKQAPAASSPVAALPAPAKPAPGPASPVAVPGPTTQAGAMKPAVAPAPVPPRPPLMPVPNPRAAAAINPYLPVPVAGPEATPVPPAAAPAKGTHQLRFTPAVDAWVQVVDGTGKRMNTLLPGGKAAGFVGVPPFKVVIGEAAQVKFSYDGRAIDLSPFIGEKVARLTLE